MKIFHFLTMTARINNPDATPITIPARSPVRSSNDFFLNFPRTFVAMEVEEDFVLDVDKIFFLESRKKRNENIIKLRQNKF